MRSASFFLLMKLSERFCLVGLELSIIVLELVLFEWISDWFESRSLMLIVYRKWLLARYLGKKVPPGALPLLVLPYIERSMASCVKLFV